MAKLQPSLIKLFKDLKEIRDTLHHHQIRFCDLHNSEKGVEQSISAVMAFELRGLREIMSCQSATVKTFADYLREQAKNEG